MLSAGSFSSPYEHLSQPETKRMVEHYTAYLSDNTRLIANPGLKVYILFHSGQLMCFLNKQWHTPYPEVTLDTSLHILLISRTDELRLKPDSEMFLGGLRFTGFYAVPLQTSEVVKMICDFKKFGILCAFLSWGEEEL